MVTLPSTEIWVRARSQMRWGAKINKERSLLRLAAYLTHAKFDADQIA
jgi:hypothetical protein